MRHKGLFVLALFLIMPVTVFADSLITKEAIVVETFDGDGATNNYGTDQPVIWKARGSKFSAEGFPKIGYANAYPEELFGKNRKDDEGLQSFAVMGSFDRKGFNYIEIVPGKGEGDNWIEEPLILPGKIEYFDLWVWGSNYDYSLEMHLIDHVGVIHRLELGSLRHVGWKHLYVKIPSNIRQVQEHIPFFRGLRLTRLVVRTDPREKVDLFTIFFDNLKVLTDTHVFNFDGQDLADPKKIEEIFGTTGGSDDAE